MSTTTKIANSPGAAKLTLAEELNQGQATRLEPVIKKLTEAIKANPAGAVSTTLTASMDDMHYLSNHFFKGQGLNFRAQPKAKFLDYDMDHWDVSISKPIFGFSPNNYISA